jgi:FkbM family methyltransferase
MTPSKLDIFIKNHFEGQRALFFVEVGAGDGITNSPTHYLEDVLQWKGVLFEGCKSQYEKCYLNRTTNLVLPIPIHHTIEEIMFVESGRHSGTLNLMTYVPESPRIIKKEASTMEHMVEIFEIKRVAVLFIDTNGSELNVLQGLRMNKCRPRLIITKNPAVKEYLEERNYEEFPNPIEGWHIFTPIK